MKLYSILLIAAITAFASSARADDTAMTKYRNYTPKQVSDMPDKQRNSVMPMAYILAAQRGLAAGSELLFGMQLNQLMYPGISDYKSAVLSFQKDLGDPATAVLTVWQIHQLEYRSALQKLGKIIFPAIFSSFKSDYYASVEGALTMLDDKAAWPVNHHEITCWKTENSCEVKQVLLDLPSQNDWTQQYKVMVDSTEYYNITRWTDDVIDAEHPKKPGACRTVSLSFNFKTKEFFFITKNAGGKCEFLGEPIEKLTKPRISQIVDGQKIIDEEFERIAKTAYEVLASDFRKSVDNLIAQSAKK